MGKLDEELRRRFDVTEEQWNAAKGEGEKTAQKWSSAGSHLQSVGCMTTIAALLVLILFALL